MYSLEDTIAAVGSAAGVPGRAGRTVVRVSGPKAFLILRQVCFGDSDVAAVKSGIQKLHFQLSCGVWVDGLAYCFVGPRSYTGQDLVELHIWAAQAVIEELYRLILQTGARQGQAGEFTQRAYLNGKLDLTQAEAVMHIISASNETQIQAAGRLLAGGLAAKISAIGQEIIELLSLLEAGLDFSEEDIEFIDTQQACRKIGEYSGRIQELLDGAVRCEELMDLPSVGLAGLPNAGKSSLMNALSARNRSIVSDMEGTTRDVLTEMLELSNGWCVLFDCAGLTMECLSQLDELAVQSATQSLLSASIVIFCVDMSSRTFQQAGEIFNRLGTKKLVAVGTKADLLSAEQIEYKIKQFRDFFDIEFFATSSKNGMGISELKTALSSAILSDAKQGFEADGRIGINLRHREKLQSALKHLAEAAEEIYSERPEVAAMFLRQARQTLGGLEHEQIDERILDVIFSRFCIGK